MRKTSLIVPLVLGGTMLAQGEGKKPNIIVILADDLGFSDLGCYGGEINTPVLDRLGKQGVRMTEMYNSARSCPSRACILTGLYPHQTGLGHMTGEHNGWPMGYSGFRKEGNVTVAEVMKDAGYFTAMSGKWHVGKQKPTERGFQEYYGLLGGFTTFWDKSKYTRLPKDRPVHQYKDGEFYSTNAITDYAVDFINQAKELNKPLFLYLAYNAPHFPLHAPKADIDKYMDIYMQGWDKIRDQRFRRLMEMGLLQGNPEMSPRGEVPGSMFVDEPHPLPAWDSLTQEQQKDLARRMAIYAAMVDIMDRNIGRVVSTLDRNGQLDNTLIFFMSDNGACAEWHEFGFDGHSGVGYTTHTGAALDSMGMPGTYHHYGTGWANVCNTPLTSYKHYAHEGGVSTPGIIWWGKGLKNPGRIDYQPCHFVDIMATCADAGKAKYPKTFDGREVKPMEGKSLMPMIKDRKMRERAVFSEHEGNRMVREGDWKLVSAYYKGHQWELYNIREDRTERRNLAARYPEKVKELETKYMEWAKRCDVLPFPQFWNEFGGGKKKFKIYRED